MAQQPATVGGAQPPATAAPPEYGYDVNAAADMIERRNMDIYNSTYGGLNGMADLLKVNLTEGITTASIASREAQFGKNELEQKEPVTFWEMIVDALGDQVIQILTIAAVVSIVFGLTLPNPHSGEIEFATGWIEGTAILISVIVVVLVGAINNYEKAKKFEELEQETSVKEITVTRDANVRTIMSSDLCVGDVMHLVSGMEIPADGMYITGFQLRCNESPITGEPDLIDKDPESAFIISGTAVEEGSGKMLVVATGMNSFVGRMKNMKDDKKKDKKKNKQAGDGDGDGDRDGGDGGDAGDIKETGAGGGGEEEEEEEEIVDGCCVCCSHKFPEWCVCSHCCMTKEALEDEEEDESTETPLQQHLSELADKIGQFGLFGAVGLVVALMIKEGILIEHYGKEANATNFLTFIIVAITLIAVAIPEGLPLAVTIALAFSMKAMMDDQCMVRVLASCETMGAATAICSDKTGTLTTNQMTVVQGLVCETEFIIDGYKLTKRDPSVTETDRKNFSIDISADNSVAFSRALSINSTARQQTNKEGELEWAGNKTEIGLLQVCKLLKHDYLKFRTDLPEGAMHQYGFSSEKKKMTTLVRETDGTVVAHVKGASEIIVSQCTRFVTKGGSVQTLDDATRAYINTVIEDMASQGNRTIALGYVNCSFTDFPKDQPDLEDLIFLGVLGVQDPIREEVPKAVRSCGSAGLIVRMVTGDNINTAKAIGTKCGLFNESTDMAMEGPVFREMYLKDEKGLMELLPKIRILARSSPKDKYILVKMLQDPEGLCEVVGVTGDGTNDAPALKLADVGFAMNTGTDIAKQNADMVLLDDNFATVVTAIKWGRAVNDNIKKFLQFQLAINFAGVGLTIVGSLASSSSKEPISPVQLLWLNLIMDTLAALSLATELPEEASLEREPVYKVAPLITNRMWSFIGIHGLYQFIIVLLLLFLGHQWFDIVEERDLCHPHNSLWTTKTQFANGTYVDSVFRWCYHQCKKVGGQFDSTTLQCAQGATHSTLIFNAFIMCQIFNVINARKIYGEANPLEGTLSRSKNLIFIFAFIALLQAIAVEFFGQFMDTTGLDYKLWLYCLAFGAFEIVVGIFVRCLPISNFVPDAAAEKTARERERHREMDHVHHHKHDDTSSAIGMVSRIGTDPSLRRSNSIHKNRRGSVSSGRSN